MKLSESIGRFLWGEHSSRDNELIEDWKSENENNSTKLEILKYAFKKDTVKPQVDTPVFFINRLKYNVGQVSAQESRIKRINWYWRAASIIILPILSVLSYIVIDNMLNSEMVSYASLNVQNGIVSEVLLPDGTKVLLNSGSTLIYPTSFKGQTSRSVELQGEGYFEVSTNKYKPFVVKTSNIGVQVLGTTFNVKAYDNDPDVSIALIEGSVKLLGYKCGYTKDLTILKPGELASLNKKQNRLGVKFVGDLSRKISWKDGKIIFDNEAFDAVLRQMSRKYNVNYIIKDKKVLEYRITATFMHETLDEYLEKLAISSPLQYEIKKSKKQADGSYTRKTVIVR